MNSVSPGARFLKCSITLLLLLVSSFASAQPLLFGKPDAPRFIILVSGLDGWNQNMDEIAAGFAEKDALVAGLDLQEYLAKPRKAKLCPASDLDKFGKEMQAQAGAKEYHHAVLAGYQAGANLVFMAQTEAPGIFSGIVSIGFCPEFPVPPEETCASEKLFESGKDNPRAPWLVVKGTGESCSEQADPFLQKYASARVIQAESNWIPQVANEIQGLSPATKTRWNELPVVEYAGEDSNNDLIIFYSGDGGWGEMEDEISRYYQQKGIASLGVDSLQYFWKIHDPVEAGKGLGKTILKYSSEWKKSHVILIGYSYGADVLPFLVNRLPKEAARHLLGVALIGPSRTIDFDTAPALKPRDRELPLMPEIKKIEKISLLCIGGNREHQSLCQKLNQNAIVANADVEMLKGGHAFGWAYQQIADLILEKLGKH